MAMVVIVSARRKLFPLLLISVALCTPFSHVGSNAVDGQLDLPDFGEQGMSPRLGMPSRHWQPSSTIFFTGLHLEVISNFHDHQQIFSDLLHCLFMHNIPKRLKYSHVPRSSLHNCSGAHTSLK